MRSVIPAVILCVAFTNTILAEPTSEPSTAAVEPEVRLFSFPPGADSIGLRLLRGHESFFISGSVNGTGVGYFLIDTGSSVTTLDEDCAGQLKIESVGRPTLQRIDGPQPAGVALVESLDAGALHVDHPRLHIVNEKSHSSQTGIPIAGVLGCDVMGQVPFTLDTRQDTLVLHNPDHFQAPHDAREFPLRPGMRTPMLRASLDGEDAWFELDTGYNSFLIFDEYRRSRLELSDVCYWKEGGGDWSERSEYYVSRWPDFSFWGYGPKRVWGVMQTKSRGNTTGAGLIGTNCIIDGMFTIDLKAHRAWVKWYEKEPLEAFLARAGDPITRDLHGVSPLLHAALRSRSDAVKALLQQRADVNAPDLFGMTPLMISAARGDVESTAALLTAGANIDARSKTDGYTPLLLASQWGEAETARLLLDAKVDVNQCTESGRSALFLAAQCDHPDVVKLLLNRAATVDLATPTGETPLVAACFHGNSDCAELLLAAHANPNARGKKGSALSYACQKPSAQCVRLLIAAGADLEKVPPSSNLRPLAHAASTRAGAGCVKLLLDAGADPNARDQNRYTALDYAISFGDYQSVELLRRVTQP
jgi:ankyrin repeat protein